MSPIIPPLVLILDDNEEFAQLITVFLNKLGVKSKIYLTSETFLKNLSIDEPDLCMMDLNLSKPGEGFILIQAIRSKLGDEIPILVMSARSDSPSITYALEVGANDYMVKPLDQAIMATKLSPYIQSQQIHDSKFTYFQVPPEKSQMKMEIEFEIEEIDELGLKMKCQHLPTKGGIFHISGETIKAMTGNEKPLFLTVASNWVLPTGNGYGCYAEFEYSNTKLMDSIRVWVTKNGEVPKD